MHGASFDQTVPNGWGIGVLLGSQKTSKGVVNAVSVITNTPTESIFWLFYFRKRYTYRIYNIFMAIINPLRFLATAGGRICCARCTAQSSRTKLQCGRPALKTSKTQKCQFHGGGPTSGKQTEAGRARIAATLYKHGESTKAARAEYSKASTTLNQLEDAMHLLKMTTAPRTRGRKPSGYLPLRSVDDVIRLVLDLEKH